MIRAKLLPHRKTLERIDIGYPRNPDLEPEQLLDLSDFPKLEHLGLSRRQVPKDLEFKIEEAFLLLAPILRTFEWDFTVKDCYGGEASYNFGEREENWLRGFMRLAVKRKAALNTVVVGFGTDPWRSPDAEDHVGSPGKSQKWVPPLK